MGLLALTLAAMDENGSNETMDVDTPALAETLNGGEIYASPQQREQQCSGTALVLRESDAAV